MKILSEGGLPVSSIVWQSNAGAWALTAVCKLTFRLEPGVAGIASQQEPVNEEDNHWNDDVARSLVAPSDLAPFKPRADVVIVGHAFAPERRPVRSLVARVCAGEVDKSIEIFCDRAFEPDGGMREGSPFVKMPLRYERASGGHDLWNPVGMPLDAAPDAYGRVPIANLQPLGTFVRWKGDTFAAVGLGPIAPQWPGRVEKLNRHARGWSHRGWNARPLPADLDVSYFNVAPSDQQTDTIHPNERLLLEHLHRDHARLVTSLPGVAPRAVVERASGYREQMALVADTLWIDTDRAICTVTWRGRIGLVHPAEQGTMRFWAEGVDLREHTARTAPPSAVGMATDPAPAIVSAPAAVPGRPAAVVHPHVDATATLAPGLEAPSRSALPFNASPWRMSPLATPGAGASKAGAGSSGSAASGAEDAAATMFLFPAMANVADTLPFARAPEPLNPHDVSLKGQGEPMQPYTPALARSSAAEQRQVADGLSLWAGPESGNASEPTLASMAKPLGDGLPFGGVGDGTDGGEGNKKGLPPMPEARAIDVSLATAGLPDAPSAEKLDPAHFTLEMCAALTARIARKKAEKRKLLEAKRLTEAEWGAIEKYWVDAIKEETRRGKRAMLDRFDLAYVARIEEERGTITVEEYARLFVAGERGTLEDVLGELGLPWGAVTRVERVWTRRLAENAALSESVEREITAARRG